MADWLIHHGIEGQKWGVRNGPPYPLSRGTYITDKDKKKDVKDRNVFKEVHTIPKGTKVYRVTSDQNESGGVVSMLPTCLEIGNHTKVFGWIN